VFSAYAKSGEGEGQGEAASDEQPAA
jgi:hypothetical protein